MKPWLQLLLVFSTTICFAQSYRVKDRVLPDTTWHEGAITRDGFLEKGLIRYNDALGLVNFRAGNDQRSCDPTQISTASYFDKSISKFRYIYSIKDGGFHMSPAARHFHELVMDLEYFAVWSKREPIHIKKSANTRVGSESGASNSSSTKSLTRSEIIYLHDKKTEKFLPVMKIEIKESGGAPGDDPAEKHGKVDFDMLEQILGTLKMDALNTYAKQNKLDWNKKDDLLDILAEVD